MAIGNNTPIHQQGRYLTQKSTEESKWLSLILGALNNYSGGSQTLLAEILAASGGSPTLYNTLSQSSLISTSTASYPGGEVHSISFSVILGTANVSFDGGSNFISYPAGSNVRIEATTTINQEIDIVIPGSALDGNNITLVQTLS